MGNALMFRQLWAFCCITVLLPAPLALAEPQRLTGAVMQLKLPGATIEIDTPIGTKIPMKFSRNGLVAGEAGVLAAFLGSAKDRGRWWVANDRLCIKWFRWFESQPRCMDIHLDGKRIQWRKEDGEKGTATLAEAPTKAAALAPAPVEPRAKSTAKSQAPTKPETANIETAQTAPATPAKPAAAQIVNPAVTQDTSPPAQRAAAQEVPPTARGGSPGAVGPAATDYGPYLPEQTDAAPAPRVRAQALPRQPQSNPAPSRKSPVTAAAGPSRQVSKKKPAAARKPARAAAKPGSFRVARVDENDMLNVRRGPSEKHAAVGIISSRGRGVKIIGECKGDWCPIRHAGITGWVNRYYLAAE